MDVWCFKHPFNNHNVNLSKSHSFFSSYADCILIRHCKQAIIFYFCDMATQEDVFKKVTSHAKEYGFVFQSSEIYDGLSAVYDYGQTGSALKKNIKDYWWDAMVKMNENIVGIDSSIFMHPKTWKASGHVDAFNDPLIDNKDSKKRYRADVLVEEYIQKVKITRSYVAKVCKEKNIPYINGSSNWIHITHSNLPNDIILKTNCKVPGSEEDWVRLQITTNKNDYKWL